MFFYNMYNTSRSFCSDCFIVSENNVPKAASLFRELQRYINEEPAFLTYLPQAKDTENIIQDIFTNTRPFNHSVLWMAMNNAIGPVKAVKNLLEPALESFQKRPSTAYFLWDEIVQFFFGYDINFDDGRRQGNPFVLVRSIQTNNYLEPMYNSPLFSDHMHKKQEELPLFDMRRYHPPLWFSIEFIMYAPKVLAVFVGAILAPFWWKTNVRNIMIGYALIVCYQAVVCVVTWAPHIRYIYPVVPLILIVASTGAFHFIK